MIAEEGAQGADGLVEGAGPELLDVLQGNQEIQHALGTQGRDVSIREVGGELLDPAVVGTAGPLREAFELDETGVVLIPFGRSGRVVFFS